MRRSKDAKKKERGHEMMTIEKDELMIEIETGVVETENGSVIGIAEGIEKEIGKKRIKTEISIGDEMTKKNTTDLTGEI